MEKKVLLIADDDEMSRKVIHRFMSDKYEVLETADGEQALNILEQKQVDALLLDIVMPKLDGLEVLKILRGSDKFAGMGILVATATKEKTERSALSLGADDVVPKPYDPMVIKKRLENILVVKDVAKQSTMADQHDISRLENEIQRKYKDESDVLSEKMLSIAHIIQENKDNADLVAQMALNLEETIADLKKLFSGEKD